MGTSWIFIQSLDMFWRIQVEDAREKLSVLKVALQLSPETTAIRPIKKQSEKIEE